MKRKLSVVSLLAVLLVVLFVCTDVKESAIESYGENIKFKVIHFKA